MTNIEDLVPDTLMKEIMESESREYLTGMEMSMMERVDMLPSQRRDYIGAITQRLKELEYA